MKNDYFSSVVKVRIESEVCTVVEKRLGCNKLNVKLGSGKQKT